MEDSSMIDSGMVAIYLLRFTVSALRTSLGKLELFLATRSEL